MSMSRQKPTRAPYSYMVSMARSRLPAGHGRTADSDRKLGAFLVVHDQRDRDARAARPGDLGRLAVVADHVARRAGYRGFRHDVSRSGVMRHPVARDV